MSKQQKQIRGSSAIGPRGHGVSFEQHETYDDSLLPDAAELSKLKELDPNIMDWVKDRTVKEQDARLDFTNRRMSLVEKAQKRAFWVDMVAICLAFIVMMGGMGLSAFLLYKDKILEGSLFAGATIFFAVRSFLNFRKPNNKSEPVQKK